MTIQVVQSRSGVPIRLTHERWQHIITRHPALRSRQARVLQTVADPDLQQVGDAGELCAVRAYGDMPPRWRYLVVVYEERSPHDGFIITAYPARRPPPHGRTLWTRP